jgi:sugar phosphate isomerase/epimerase
MKRRRFVGGAAAIATGAALASVATQARAQSRCAPAIGVQLFTLRDELQRGLLPTLARLRELGIAEVELFGFGGGESGRVLGLAPAELKQAFEEHGIRAPLAHVDGALANVAEISALARALGVARVVVGLPAEFTATRDGRFTIVAPSGRAQLDALAGKLDRAGSDYASHGIGFGYHNHHVELAPVDGVVPLDYLMSRTSPDVVKLELDLGWLALAGADPVEYLRRHAGRVVACHLKDYDPRIVSDDLARKLLEPGGGSIDFAAVLAAMRDAGVAHGFIEIDQAPDPLGAVARGSRHLRAILDCAA